MVVGELTEEREVIIIGGGPGGYNAAIRAAQFGLQVTLIEKEQLGGICLNKGCIPSKIHTHAAKQLYSLNKTRDLGIECSNVNFNLNTLQTYKQHTITQLRKGIESLCKANKIEILYGQATFLSPNKIGLEKGHNYNTYSFNNAIIATGAKRYPIINLDDYDALTSTSIFNLNELPSHLVIYGSDYISLEVATSFRTFGCEVTILLEEGKEHFDFDGSINRELNRILKKNKIKIYKSVSINSIKKADNNTSISFSSNGKEQMLQCSHFYSETTVKPELNLLGLDRANISVTESGYIKVDKAGRTIQEHIFAIGDVTEGPPLAIKAIKQGKVAAETIANNNLEIDLNFLPTVLHTVPPIAFAGLSEEKALLEGYEIKTSTFPLASNGYATITGEKDGFVKVISEEGTDLLLGVQMIGNGALELISTGVNTLEMVGREEDLLFPHYPHPSINEAFLEAVEGLTKKAIHLPPVKNKAKEMHKLPLSQ